MAMTQMQQWMTWIEYIGAVAFSVSGALTGLKKHMDIFGVMVLGLTTATAGGVIRDLILGISPPLMFQNPIYAILAMITALVTFLPPVRRLAANGGRVYDTILFAADTLGLAIFAVMGVNTAIAAMPSSGLFLLVFVGCVSAVGGGVLRDVMAGQTPYIFVKHIYALASIVGALICAAFWKVSPAWAMMAGFAAVVLIRCLSSHFRWNLPHS